MKCVHGGFRIEHMRDADGPRGTVRVRADHGDGAFAKTKKRAGDALLAEMFRERFEGAAFAEAAEVEHHSVRSEFQGVRCVIELKLVHAGEAAGFAERFGGRHFAALETRAPKLIEGGLRDVESAAGALPVMVALGQDFPESGRNGDGFRGGALIQFGNRAERIEAAHQAFLRAEMTLGEFGEGFTGTRIQAGQHQGKARAHRTARVVEHSRSWSGGNFAGHFNSIAR